jgi:hypothetical protein
LPLGDDEQVPLLFWPVVAGELEGGAGADVWAGQADVEEDVGGEGLQGTHLSPAGDRATRSCIDLPGLDLLLLLAGPGVPERLYGLLEPVLQIC